MLQKHAAGLQRVFSLADTAAAEISAGKPPVARSCLEVVTLPRTQPPAARLNMLTLAYPPTHPDRV